MVDFVGKNETKRDYFVVGKALGWFGEPWELCWLMAAGLPKVNKINDQELLRAN